MRAMKHRLYQPANQQSPRQHQGGLPMNALPTARSWAEVKPGIEYIPASPLKGWRTSVAMIDGTISPFLDHGTTAKAQCHASATDRRHDGAEVHPACACGLNLLDSRRHLVDYWPDAAARYGAAREDIGAWRWGGVVVCMVSTAGNVTGRADWPGMNPPDSDHTYRTSAFTLEQVFVPTGTVTGLPDRIRRKYNVPVIQMRGPFHTIAQPRYAEATR